MTSFFKSVREFCAASLLAAFYWTLSRTYRYRHIGRPPRGDRPLVYAHWHGDELLLMGAYVRSGMAIMASRSKDGELVKRMLEWLGFHVVRGSSSRGGAAGLKGLIDAVGKGGFDGSLAVDGPRGPIYQVKPGVLKLAQQTGCLLVPGAAAASRRFVFKRAWNRCYLPLPFAKCVIVYGDPLAIPREWEPEKVEALRLELERKLARLKADAESRFSRTADPSLTRVLALDGV